MHRPDPQTERRGGTLATALSALCLLASLIRLSAPGPSWRVLAGVGLGGLVLRLLAPRLVERALGPLDVLLRHVGERVSTLVLTVLYLVVVVPWSLMVRRWGLIARPEEPWPPDASGWQPVDAREEGGRAAVGLVAGAMVRAGGAVRLVRFFAQRPSLFLLPIVLVVLALAAFAMFGEASGLGPLVYTLF